jgi:hypothetical protein
MRKIRAWSAAGAQVLKPWIHDMIGRAGGGMRCTETHHFGGAHIDAPTDRELGFNK